MVKHLTEPEISMIHDGVRKKRIHATLLRLKLYYRFEKQARKKAIKGLFIPTDSLMHP